MRLYQRDACRLSMASVVFWAALLVQGCGRNTDLPVDGTAIGGLVCSKPVWDIGEIDPQQQRQLTHTFLLMNGTDKTIAIRSVKPDCGCLVASNTPDTIPANGAASVAVDLNVTDLPGVLDHFVLVQFNAGEEYTLPLRIRGRVAATNAIHVSPGILDFTLLATPEKKTRIARVQRRNGSAVEVLRVSSDLSTERLEFRRSPDGVSTDVLVTLSPDKLPPGEISGSIIVDVADSEQSPLHIPVKGNVSGIGDSFVSSLVVESIRPGDTADYSILKSVAPSSVGTRISRVSYEGDIDMQVSLGQASHEQFPAPRQSGRINIAVSSTAARGSMVKGVVSVFFEGESKKQIDVPIFAFVR